MGNDCGRAAGRGERDVSRARRGTSGEIDRARGAAAGVAGRSARAISGRHAGGQEDARGALAICSARTHRQGSLRRRSRNRKCCCTCCASARCREVQAGTLGRAAANDVRIRSAAFPERVPKACGMRSEAAAHVREMFGRIAPRYDLLNHLLSLDIDKVWRRRVAKKFQRGPAQSECARARSVLRHGRSGVRVSQGSAGGRGDHRLRFCSGDAGSRARQEPRRRRKG